MHRRRFLTALAGLSGLGVSGCLAAPRARSETTPTRSAPGRFGFPSDICTEAPKADPGIYALTDPVFASDWTGVSIRDRYRRAGHTGLAPDQPVVGLRTETTARAYPLSVLWYHEAVNDTLDETPVLVTYCSLCRSGMVADRRVAGRRATFRVSGLLWAAPQLQEAVAEREGRIFGADRNGAAPIRHSGNVVLVDDVTESYWSQILAEAICGPLARQRLDIVPSTLTTWAAWREDVPETEVLVPPPHSGTMATR